MSRRRWIGTLAVVALAVGALALVWARRPEAASGPTTSWAGATRANLLLVTIDTLRADRVGAYGHAAAQTPTLDRLAREGALVEDAVVQVPQTRPSHASIFTGRMPYEHGIRDNFSPPLDATHPTLATLLREQGYATGAFIGSYPVSRDSGLDRGFDVYDDPFGGSSEALRLERSARRAERVVDAALAWLEDLEARPFFAWVHVFDPHTPYDPPSPFRERLEGSPYDGEVAYADAQIGRLVDWLDEAGLREQTLVVATSDHGEGLGDHGEDEHHLFVYDSTLRVPLVISWPGQVPEGLRVGGQFRSVDLLPTLVELLGGTPPSTSGESRAGVLRSGGTIPRNDSYAESLYGQIHFGWAPVRALRAAGWKYIDTPRAELYHLAEDPGERENRLGEDGEGAARLRDRLRALDSEAPTAAAIALDPDAAEQLAALGYVGGAFYAGVPSGDDPKDRITEYTAFRRETTAGVQLFEAGDFAGAVGRLQPLTETRVLPDGRTDERSSYTVSLFLGRALVELGRFEEAIEPLETAVDFGRATPPLFAFLARAQAGAGRFEEAAATTARGLALAPEQPGLVAIKGRLLLQQGAVGPALVALEEARRLNPKAAGVRVDLANVLRATGRVREALAEANEAVRLAPSLADAHVTRGLSLARLDRAGEAAAAFERALSVQPAHPDALFFLAMAEMQTGRVDAARQHLTRLVQVAPAYPKAREMLARVSDGRAASPPPAEMRLRMLRVPERARAEEALRRARAGEDFGAVVRSLDSAAPGAGDLGRVRVADLAEPLRRAARSLAPGELSPILPTPGGYVLLKRED